MFATKLESVILLDGLIPSECGVLQVHSDKKGAKTPFFIDDV
jgi:hypothetical protein